MILLLLIPLAGLPGNLPENCRLFASSLPKAETDSAGGLAAAAGCLPWRMDLWEAAAKQALQENQPEAAMHYLERAIQETSRFQPNAGTGLSLPALLDLAAASYQIGDYETALKTWGSISDRVGLNEQSAEMLARLQLVQADFAAARQTWQAVIDHQPQNAQAHFELGLLLCAYEPESALQHLEQAAALDLRWDETASILRRAILSARIGENPAYSLLACGRALASLNYWHLAAEAFRQAILKQPGFAEAWAYLGEARQHLPQGENPSGKTLDSDNDGLLELQTAVELNPQSLAAQTLLSLYWQRKGEYLPALEAIQQALAIEPDNPVLTAQMAAIQAEAGDFEGAYQTYLKAAERSPHDPTHLRQIIQFSLDYNYHIEEIALPIARRLLADDPQSPTDLDLMARILIYLGDLSNAEKFLHSALSVNPRFAPAHLHLGLVFLLQGDQQSAHDHLITAQLLDPGGPNAEQAARLLDYSTP